MSSKYPLNPHALVRFLEKDAKDFTKDDIMIVFQKVCKSFLFSSLQIYSFLIK